MREREKELWYVQEATENASDAFLLFWREFIFWTKKHVLITSTHPHKCMYIESTCKHAMLLYYINIHTYTHTGDNDYWPQHTPHIHTTSSVDHACCVCAHMWSVSRLIIEQLPLRSLLWRVWYHNKWPPQQTRLRLQVPQWQLTINKIKIIIINKK